MHWNVQSCCCRITEFWWYHTHSVVECILTLVWVVPVAVPIYSAGVAGKGWLQRGAWGWAAEWVLEVQSTEEGRGGGAAWRQVFHLLPSWRGLSQSSGVRPEPASSLAGAWMEVGGVQDMPWGLESGLWEGPARKSVTHLFFQLMWFAPGHM